VEGSWQAVAANGQARSCVFVFLFREPSHIDLQNMKLSTPAEIRSEFPPASSESRCTNTCRCSISGGIYKSELKSHMENDVSLIILFADNLKATRDHVTKHGGSICKNIISFPDERRFQFLDPHGNELGI